MSCQALSSGRGRRGTIGNGNGGRGMESVCRVVCVGSKCRVEPDNKTGCIEGCTGSHKSIDGTCGVYVFVDD